MSRTFFFYDLETSGLNPRGDRIMQFAGQRTDENLNKIGEGYNILVKTNDDTLPSPGACLVTKITPQKTVEEGYTEAEFCKMATEEFFTPDTIVVGYNNVRFDDEFMRHIFWRNYYDPYEWQWKDGRSRWDLLDVVRLTRAIRPDGINWPVLENGDSVNKLELLTKENGIEHENAHDAMADVEATIAVAKLLKEKQPKMFDYLLKMRSKNEVANLVNLEKLQPFVYASGRYDKKFEKTTVALPLTLGRNKNILVYDLRVDPKDFVKLSEEEVRAKINASWDERKKDDFVPLPVKELAYNKCPAVAPLGVLESGNGWKKLGLTPDMVEERRAVLLQNPDFAEKVRTALEDRPAFERAKYAESQLYDGFLNDSDKIKTNVVRSADEKDLTSYAPDFIDERLSEMFIRYKARNFPKTLSKDEEKVWQEYRMEKLHSELPKFLEELEEKAKEVKPEGMFILEELKLWAESILPEDDFS